MTFVKLVFIKWFCPINVITLYATLFVSVLEEKDICIFLVCKIQTIVFDSQTNPITCNHWTIKLDCFFIELIGLLFLAVDRLAKFVCDLIIKINF